MIMLLEFTNACPNSKRGSPWSNCTSLIRLRLQKYDVGLDILSRTILQATSVDNFTPVEFIIMCRRSSSAPHFL